MNYKMVCTSCGNVFESKYAKKNCDACSGGTRKRASKYNYDEIARYVLSGRTYRDVVAQYGIQVGQAAMMTRAIISTKNVMEAGK